MTRRKYPVISVVTIIMIALLASGCAALAGGSDSGESNISGTTTADTPPNSYTDDTGSTVNTDVESPDHAAAPPTSGGENEFDAGRADGEESISSPEEGADYSMPPVAGTPLPQNVTVPDDQRFAQPLQAGEIDDNDEFAAYLQYRIDFNRFSSIPIIDVDITERHLIRVRNANGLPVLGADIFVYDGQFLVTTLKTTAAGTAYLFPRAYATSAQTLNVVVEKAQQRESFNLSRADTDATWDVTLRTRTAQEPVNLDVLFLLDATGSMSEEIRQLQDNLLSISAQIKALPAHPDVRFGLVHYRDRGDMYVTQTVDFTADINRFQKELNAVYADGGGDIPESLNEALYQAVNGASWRVDDTVSVIILVADAPPHLDYPQDHSYAREMLNAASLGIKIFPIGVPLDPWTSGREVFEPQAEYVFRQLAQFTGGHLIMLLSEDTPQASGDPGTTYGVADDRYSVEDLDALVVRLIREELDQLMAKQQ